MNSYTSRTTKRKQACSLHSWKVSLVRSGRTGKIGAF